MTRPVDQRHRVRNPIRRRLVIQDSRRNVLKAMRRGQPIDPRNVWIARDALHKQIAMYRWPRVLLHIVLLVGFGSQAVLGRDVFEHVAGAVLAANIAISWAIQANRNRQMLLRYGAQLGLADSWARLPVTAHRRAFRGR
jgi:hypothetical protein